VKLVANVVSRQQAAELAVPGAAGGEAANKQLGLLWNCFSKRKAWLFSDTVTGAKASAII
jgi:hypothetical protein